MKKELNKPTGFTIVELMIVLAIASLIISIVFLAVPQLQRSQRDSTRKGIASRVLSELEAYASNNQGTYPFAGLTTTYAACNSILTDPGGCNVWRQQYIDPNSQFRIDPSTGAATGIYMGLDPDANNPPSQAPGGGSPGGSFGKGNMFVAVGATCTGGKVDPTYAGSSTTKTYAVAINLEQTGSYYCIDNR